jgi:hypothetical protein
MRHNPATLKISILNNTGIVNIEVRTVAKVADFDTISTRIGSRRHAPCSSGNFSDIEV